MSAPNDGGPAFPQNADERESLQCVDGKIEPVGHNGMSLLDWFAGHETLSDWDVADACMPKDAGELLAGRPRPTTGNYVDYLIWEADWRARLRFIRADAMLKARAAK